LSERFLIIRINNNRSNFHLGLSDYLNEESGVYQEVKRTICVGGVNGFKGYFVRGGLLTEGYYNIVEFEKSNIVYFIYDPMVAAIQSESDFNFKLFLFLNAVVIILFVVSLIESAKSNEKSDAGVATTMELLIDGTKIKGSMNRARRLAGWAAPLFIAIIVFVLSVFF